MAIGNNRSGDINVDLHYVAAQRANKNTRNTGVAILITTPDPSVNYHEPIGILEKPTWYYKLFRRKEVKLNYQPENLN